MHYHLIATRSGSDSRECLQPYPTPYTLLRLHVFTNDTHYYCNHSTHRNPTWHGAAVCHNTVMVSAGGLRVDSYHSIISVALFSFRGVVSQYRYDICGWRAGLGITGTTHGTTTPAVDGLHQ